MWIRSRRSSGALFMATRTRSGSRSQPSSRRWSVGRPEHPHAPLASGAAPGYSALFPLSDGVVTVHILKLCVGVSEPAELAAWQKKRWNDAKKKGKKPECRHITRNTPKRAEEIIDGGSL